MNSIFRVAFASALLGASAQAQTPSFPADITTQGFFTGVSSSQYVPGLIRDNNLEDGYMAGSDIYGAPASMQTTAERGNSFMQWGAASGPGDHPYALWFERAYAENVTPDTPFDVGHFYYRNGTVTNETYITTIFFQVGLVFPGPTSINGSFPNPMLTTLTTQPWDTPNDQDHPSGNPDSFAIIWNYATTPFQNEAGEPYWFKVGFKDPIGGTANGSVFTVPDGQVGKVTLTGMFTTVPEPSSALLGALGALALRRRRR